MAILAKKEIQVSLSRKIMEGEQGRTDRLFTTFYLRFEE